MVQRARHLLPAGAEHAHQHQEEGQAQDNGKDRHGAHPRGVWKLLLLLVQVMVKSPSLVLALLPSLVLLDGDEVDRSRRRPDGRGRGGDPNGSSRRLSNIERRLIHALGLGFAGAEIEVEI